MKKFWKKTEGFTLVELVVVIAILGILAGVGTVGYSGYVKKANMAADQTMIRDIANAVELANYSQNIATKAGCPEWAVSKYQGQCRSFTMEQLKQAIKDGVDYEEAVKTGRMNDQMAVELFIVQYS